MHNMRRLGLVVFVITSAISCDPPAPRPATMRVLPEQTFSGFDGEHTFQAPIAVFDSAADLDVSPEDSSAVTVERATPTAGYQTARYFLITVKAAGKHKIVARSGGQRAEIVVNAESYSTDDWKRGEKRYLKGSATGDPPCTQCHNEGGVDHSPSALAAASDAALRTPLTKGMTVFGKPILIDGKAGHKWAISDDDRAVLSAYLRSLPPSGFE
jgi:hypothetical protein